MMAVEMLDEIEGHHGFEHRDFDKATLAGCLPPDDRGQDGDAGRQARYLVGDDRRHVARGAGRLRHQVGHPRHTLNDIVIRWQPAIRPGLAEAVEPGKDEMWMTGEQDIGFKAQ